MLATMNEVGSGFAIGLTLVWLILTIVNMWLQPDLVEEDGCGWRSWKHKIRIELALTLPIAIAIIMVMIFANM